VDRTPGKKRRDVPNSGQSPIFLTKAIVRAIIEIMPRTARASVGGICYHVVNRGNNRAKVFHKPEDLSAFVTTIADACEYRPMRVLSYCVMPNHFHLVLWPLHDLDLSRWMQWLLSAQVRRYHRDHGGSGHVWEGRFRCFPIQPDHHLLSVMRYVESNPVRAKLAKRAENWRWSSLGYGPDRIQLFKPAPAPIKRGRNWLEKVNTPFPPAELQRIRQSVNRGTPLGTDPWVQETAALLGLESSMRPRGRPRIHPQT
jgi:putative transposase